MEDITKALFTELGISLATLAVKGTATSIQTRVKTIRSDKNLESVRASYDEIINELLQEREESIRIAKAYKEEFEKIVISEEDIKHLHDTLSRVLNLIDKVSPGINVKTLENIKDLIGVDTLKTMQLLGFNYKKAIGEPLTNLCADKITSISKNKTKTNSKKLI